MLLIHSKLLALLIAFFTAVGLGYSWDYLTERPRHRKMKEPTKEDE